MVGEGDCFGTSGHEVPGDAEDGAEDRDSGKDVLLLAAVEVVVYPRAEAPAAGTRSPSSHRRRRRRKRSVFVCLVVRGACGGVALLGSFSIFFENCQKSFSRFGL
jgi:hypothetical protein